MLLYFANYVFDSQYEYEYMCVYLHVCRSRAVRTSGRMAGRSSARRTCAHLRMCLKSMSTSDYFSILGTVLQCS